MRDRGCRRARPVRRTGRRGLSASLLGAIVAGGRATRFGGDKGAALLDGRALIDHAADAIRPFVDALVIVGRDWPGLARIEDRPHPHLGPLGGIAGALAYARHTGHAHVLTIGCDMPRVPAALIARLVTGRPAFCPDAPVLGVWAADWAEALAARLTPDADRSVRRWAAAVGATPVPSDAPLANVNTPADLA